MNRGGGRVRIALTTLVALVCGCGTASDLSLGETGSSTGTGGATVGTARPVDVGATPSFGGYAASGGHFSATTGGIPSSGGTRPTGTGGTLSPQICGTTAAGTAIGKNLACAAADTQLCYKTCGPGGVGSKLETCVNGVYVEGDCTFPAQANYACLRVPMADAPGCLVTPPQHNTPCSLPICMLGSLGTGCAQTAPCDICGVAMGYLDSAGTSKAGYCVCVPAASGGGKFACATVTAWPCPMGAGC